MPISIVHNSIRFTRSPSSTPKRICFSFALVLDVLAFLHHFEIYNTEEKSGKNSKAMRILCVRACVCATLFRHQHRTIENMLASDVPFLSLSLSLSILISVA